VHIHYLGWDSQNRHFGRERGSRTDVVGVRVVSDLGSPTDRKIGDLSWARGSAAGAGSWLAVDWWLARAAGLDRVLA